MKKLFLIFCFLALNTALYSANVYFDYPVNNATYYSDINGNAGVSYHIHTVSYFFVVDWYGARVQYPDGHWGEWQDGQSGGWVFHQAGIYHIEGGVHVYYDLGGSGDYFMYSNILTFNVIDNNAPAVPQNFIASFTGQHPILTWTDNIENDLSSYSISKRVVDETGWAIVATIFSPTSQWTDNTVSQPGKFDPVYTIEYKIKANDINNNSSSYSPIQSVTGTTEYFWKISNNSEDKIIRYELFSNYPNPFNPTTSISYSLETPGYITLIVYNLLGQEVAELVNESQEKGYHTVNFIASNLSSGIYIYKLNAGEFTEIRKMQLIK